MEKYHYYRADTWHVHCGTCGKFKLNHNSIWKLALYKQILFIEMCKTECFCLYHFELLLVAHNRLVKEPIRR